MLFGGTQRGATLIWGYTEGYNFDLGVRKYQKVENPWTNVIIEIRLPDVKVVIRLTNVNCEIRLHVPDVLASDVIVVVERPTPLIACARTTACSQ